MKFDQDLCLNLWYELNPQVRYAFGNVFCIPLKNVRLSAKSLFYYFSGHLEKEASFGIFPQMEEEVVEFFAFCILKGRQVLAVLVFSREMSAQFLCRPPRCLTQAAQRAAFIFQIGMKCVLFLQISIFIFCTKHIANNFQNSIEQCNVM